MRFMLLTAGLLAGLSQAYASQDYGTAGEARAMLEAAVAAVISDKDAALASFTAGAAPFKVKDLYVFCGNDGIITAHGAKSTLVGQDSMPWNDKAGKAFVREMYEVATEGEFRLVGYMWPRPGSEEPVQKETYVTRVADQMCGVGYYK